MRALLLLAVLSVAASAQPALDVSVAGGAVVLGTPGLAGTGSATVTVTPGLPRGLRAAAAVTAGPGSGRNDDGRMAALGLGIEAPLSGGRHGVYLALGAALLHFDNYDPGGCLRDPDCMFEGVSVSPHTGLAATGGLGARVPVGRLTVEPALSAMVWGDVLLGARLGVGWRIR